jgi:hypothetical protein
MKQLKLKFICLFLVALINCNLFAALPSPQSIANPANDDELFFNFRLANFAPKTEKLMEQYCGWILDMKIDSESIWEYNSYNSHCVGFTTKYPAMFPIIAQIEYGETTDYGSLTEQSESYYFNHLIYIKDLKPNTTYHYRIVYRSEDMIIDDYSDDFVFTTKELTNDVIRIPEDMAGEPPYTLTQSGAKYVITKDFVCPTLFINIKANDIEIDLNGHTIIYDNESPVLVGDSWDDYAYGETASMGIRTGLWNYISTKVFNGVIKQGSNGGFGYIGVGFNPLYLGHMGEGSFNEVAGVTVDYYGGSISGMICGNGYIHHNVLYDRGTEVDDRHQGIKAMNTGGGTSNEISFNSLRRFRHQGIMGNGNKFYNELYSDSYATNSFLISLGGCTAAFNKLFGTGFNPVGMNWGSNSIIQHNFIYMHGTAPNQRSDEYDRISGIAGVRFTNYGDNEGTKNMIYEDNIIVLKAWAGCPTARGIWTATNPVDSGFVYRNNTVKTEILSYDDINFDLVEYCVTCVDLNGTSVVIGGDTLPPIYFDNNTFIGNAGLINFGSSYGVGGSGHFYNTKLEKINTFDAHFKPVRLGYYPFNTFNNLMIDTKIGDGINIDPPIFHHLGSTQGYMEVTYGSRSIITLWDLCKMNEDEENITIPNADVTIKIDNDKVLLTQTDDEGRIDFNILTVKNECKGNTKTRTEYKKYKIIIDGYDDAEYDVEDLLTYSIISLNCKTGIDDDAENSITLYPNAANDYITISGLLGNETITISDILANELINHTAANETESINVNSLADGSYLVNISNNKRIRNIKLVIKR